MHFLRPSQLRSPEAATAQRGCSKCSGWGWLVVVVVVAAVAVVAVVVVAAAAVVVVVVVVMVVVVVVVSLRSNVYYTSHRHVGRGVVVVLTGGYVPSLQWAWSRSTSLPLAQVFAVLFTQEVNDFLLVSWRSLEVFDMGLRRKSRAPSPQH